MPIGENLAYRLALKLTLIPDCPQGVTESLADELTRLFSDDAEASEMVSEACQRWDSWRGVHGLSELMEAKHPEPPPSNQAKDYGPRPKPDCETCADWGYFTGRDGQARWCTCTAAFETLAKEPGLVDALNQKHVKPLHQAREDGRKITQADVDKLLKARKSRNR